MSIQFEIENVTCLSTEDVENVFLDHIEKCPSCISETQRKCDRAGGTATMKVRLRECPDGDGIQFNTGRRSWTSYPTYLWDVPKKTVLQNYGTAMEMLTTDSNVLHPDLKIQLVQRLHERVTGKLVGKVERDRLFIPERQVLIVKRASPPKVKKTEGEKLAYLKEMYDPHREMDGSSTVQRWRWNTSEIEGNYEAEWRRREEWRRKFEAAGGRLEPHEIHETFSEYLRRRADEWDRNQASRRK